MIKKIFFLLLIHFLVTTLFSENFLKLIRTHLQEKRFVEALKLTEKELSKNPDSEILKRIKIDVYLEAGQHDEALGFIGKGLKKNDKDLFLLSQKIRVSLMKRDFNEALDGAVKMDRLREKKLPSDSFMIARIYLKQMAPDEAMEWLNESAERGFIDYMVMRSQEFTLLHRRADFLELIGKMKIAAGVGELAKVFEAKLFNKEKRVSINQYKGRVLVLLFTGSWSRAAYSEVGKLIEIYPDLRKKGVEILEINLDTNLRYVKNQKRPWGFVSSLKGWKDPVVKLYGVKSVPSIWLVGKKGYLRSFGLKGKELHEVIQKLLQE